MFVERSNRPFNLDFAAHQVVTRYPFHGISQPNSFLVSCQEAAGASGFHHHGACWKAANHVVGTEAFKSVPSVVRVYLQVKDLWSCSNPRTTS